jgi:predicted GH43/DUF377 family glycosyl hydrolase
MQEWTAPELLATPCQQWEGNRIGGGLPPLKTRNGWLVIYHGVEEVDRSARTVVYRTGAMMLDLDDPRKILGRTRAPILVPREYYELFGLYIPNVVFPTGGFIRDGELFLYYGVCDTAIALATAPLERVLTSLV